MPCPVGVFDIFGGTVNVGGGTFESEVDFFDAVWCDDCGDVSLTLSGRGGDVSNHTIFCA